jgi:transcription elongation factor Elf1
MKLQINYTCDVCEETIHINFEKSFHKTKLECPHCGVLYNFSEEDFTKLNNDYNDLLDKISSAKKENISEPESLN